MTDHLLPTQFAPAERATAAELERQTAAVSQSVFLRDALNAIPDILVILNRQRQIIYANQRLLDQLEVSDARQVQSRRPGEALNCIHASEREGGCGTTEFCSTCGAAQAILASLRGQTSVQECRITQASGQSLDLRVWAKPLTLAGEQFTLFTLLDIGDEKRRRALERIFFHDLMNTAANIQSYLEILREMPEAPEAAGVTQTLRLLSRVLIDEIYAQRDLVAAESQELATHPEWVDAVELVQGLAAEYEHRQLRLPGSATALRVEAQVAALVTDRTLLRRVLSNLLKNALEAGQPGETVTMACGPQGDRVVFTVHNPAVMPRAVQLQVFQRSFSTKGAGRGLGTYSIKLLSERYLMGTVTFTSLPEAGTTFVASFPVSYPETAPTVHPQSQSREGV